MRTQHYDDLDEETKFLVALSAATSARQTALSISPAKSLPASTEKLSTHKLNHEATAEETKLADLMDTMDTMKQTIPAEQTQFLPKRVKFSLDKSSEESSDSRDSPQVKSFLSKSGRGVD